MKKYMLVAALALSAYACSNSGSAPKGSTEATANNSSGTAGATSNYDSTVGAGKFTHVDLAAKLDPKMAAAGESVYQLKCAACHKLTGEKLVGPGWQAVTDRHKPEWILNFVTNTDEMIDKDPKAQAMLAICMVRMPNQHLNDADARNILEFMRKNDGIK